MFDDIYKNIRLSMSERLSSPLMTSFVISWLIWNYRFVLIVFSSESIDDKLFLIDEEITFGWAYIKSNGFLYPLYSSLFYIFIYPIPAMLTYGVHKFGQSLMLKIRRVIENEMPMTKDEHRNAQLKLEKKRIEIESLVDDKDDELNKIKESLNQIIEGKDKEIGLIIDRFNSEIEVKNGDILSLQEKLDKLTEVVRKKEDNRFKNSDRLTKRHLMIIEYLYDVDGEMYVGASLLSNDLKINKRDVGYLLDDLYEWDFVDFMSSLHEKTYKISRDGVRYMSSLREGA